MAQDLVIVPTYQERHNLPVLLAGLAEHLPDADILVVDDASPDGSGEFAQQAGAHVLHRAAKHGLGPAYRAGFQWALDRPYERIAAMDADLSHDPVALPELFQGLDRADLVIGSRYVPGGRIEDWPQHRRVLSRGGNSYARWLTGCPVRDATSGYRVFRRQALTSIDVTRLRSNGYAFQVETAVHTYRAGFRIDELPIVFEERRAGASKLSRAVVIEAVWRMPALALRGPRRPRGWHPLSVSAT